MNTTLVVGIVMVILGAVVLGYDHFSYTTTENIIQIGPLKANVEQSHRVSLPPILGWLLIGAGVAVGAYGAMARKR